MTTIKIRKARPLDASNLFRLLTEAHEETTVYPPTDPAMGLNWISRTLIEGYVLVADVSGRLVGTLALTNYQFPWSPQWYLYLEWLFVQKKFRNDGAFHALLKAAHAYADELKAPMFMGVSSGDAEVFLKDKLFQQSGYIYLGGEFIRRKHSGQGQERDDNADVHATVMG